MAAEEYAVYDKFEKFEQAYRCADVPGVAYAVSSNGDSGLVGIFFVGPILACNFGVRDLVTAIVGSSIKSCRTSLRRILTNSGRSIGVANPGTD